MREKGTRVFWFVAEQESQEMDHLRLPALGSHCGDQVGFGE